jgi:serine protease Do
MRKSGDQTKTEAVFGLTVQTLTADLAKQFDVADSAGVVVTAVADGSLAQDAELQHGDVITEVDRKPVRNVDDFKSAMAKADAKKGALIFIKREGGAMFVVLKER